MSGFMAAVDLSLVSESLTPKAHPSTPPLLPLESLWEPESVPDMTGQPKQSSFQGRAWSVRGKDGHRLMAVPCGCYGNLTNPDLRPEGFMPALQCSSSVNHLHRTSQLSTGTKLPTW